MFAQFFNTRRTFIKNGLFKDLLDSTDYHTIETFNRFAVLFFTQVEILVKNKTSRPYFPKNK